MYIKRNPWTPSNLAGLHEIYHKSGRSPLWFNCLNLEKKAQKHLAIDKSVSKAV